ncbi:MAG: flagellar hook-basal body complex protein [Phycisphaerae bacterium]|nr:flagellar hook-basal body complex protein [Phycisphaerae bacterium]
MASTTAMFTALSGMNANARHLDVIGNNIANVNTTAYKQNRMLFATQFARTFSVGTPPEDTTGGTNPGQIGLGVAIAGTQRNFSTGTISATGDGRDLAIEGSGFFVLDRGGRELYTRAGAFRQNSANDLVTITGDRVMGWGVDDRFNVVRGQLRPMNIPLGSLSIAEATQNVHLSGNLNAGGSLPTRGALIDLMGTATAGLSAVAGASPPPGAGNVLEAATRLVDVEDPQLPGSGTPLFVAGQTILITGAERGGRLLPDARLTVAATTTVQELMDFLSVALGIDTGVGVNPDGRTPGISIDPTTGVLSVTGNVGTVNDLRVDSGDLRLLSASGQFVRTPLVATQQGSADGESVRTTMIVYDSLGTPVEVDVAMVLASKSDAGTTWRYFASSADDTDAALPIGTGIVEFDQRGRLATTAPVSLVVDRAGTGAITPLAFSLYFSQGQDQVTALTSSRSELAATYRDGSPLGTLGGFAVGVDGTIVGSFTNGLTRTIGQVAIAMFANDEGLVDEGGSTFSTGPNSGSPQIIGPGELGSGKIVGGAVELSNVDLGNEFIQMILASTGYSASSRVIRTADELMQQLLVLGR